MQARHNNAGLRGTFMCKDVALRPVAEGKYSNDQSDDDRGLFQGKGTLDEHTRIRYQKHR